MYHEVHTQYMYHVEFSDGDCCDYWRHELEMVKYRYKSTAGSDSYSKQVLILNKRIRYPVCKLSMHT